MNPQFPSFSVLLSVYAKDNPVWVAQALDSVLNNTVRPTEVAVAVDGPIPEKLHTVLEEYAQKEGVINWHFPQNRGRGAALQEAVPKCTYELVALMDADDICLPNRFEKLLQYFQQHPETDICGGQNEEVDAQTVQTISFRRVPLTDTELKQYVKSRSPFNQQTVLFRKAAVQKAGGYRAFHLFEDYDLWVRMAHNGAKMANLPDALVKMRIDEHMFARRGGWKYFKSNLALQNELLQYKMISLPRYCFNVLVRFTVQVLMPNSLRGWFYRKVLR